jgi:hypothetical protein
MSVGDLGERGAPVAVERKIGKEHEALAGAVVDDVVVGALGEIETILDGGDRNDLTGPLNLLDPTLETPTCRIFPLSRYSLIAPRLSSSGVCGSTRWR